jgi:hypothetical protein
VSDFIELKTASAEGANYVTLFSIDEVEYRVPDKVRANLQLKYLKKLREMSEAAAAGWLLEEMLGADAYDALADYEDLTEENFDAIMKAVEKIVLGSKEKDPKGRRG